MNRPFNLLNDYGHDNLGNSNNRGNIDDHTKGNNIDRGSNNDRGNINDHDHGSNNDHDHGSNNDRNQDPTNSNDNHGDKDMNRNEHSHDHDHNDRDRYDSSSPRRGDYDRPYHRPNSDSHATSIPGTNLKTRTFYKLGIKSFPNGVIRWTPQTNPQQGYHYVHIDNNWDHRRRYERDGEWFKDAQWEFVPVSSNERHRWYKLRNRARPREYLTWSATEFVNEDAQANYLVLDGNYPGRRSRRDFLFRPVRPRGYNENRGDRDRDRDRDDGEYYQLRVREMPRGVVTWSNREFERYTNYMEVDHSKDEEHMRKYQRGHDWYEDTLFRVEQAEKDYIDDEEDIEESDDRDIDRDDDQY